MATVSPKVGVRGTQNVNAAFNVTASNLISTRVVCSQFTSLPLKDISFKTTNVDPYVIQPIGLNEQFRIDNSGNMSYFGAPPINVFNLATFFDTSCNIAYNNKMLELNVATNHYLDPSLLGFLRIDILFAGWAATDYVLVNSKVLACSNSSVGPGMTCAGYTVNRNRTTPDLFPPPLSVKWFRFEDSTGSIAVSNGTLIVGSGGSYTLRYQFNPTNKPDNIVVYIGLIHAVLASQIRQITVTMF